jgi:hypothetical protein
MAVVAVSTKTGLGSGNYLGEYAFASLPAASLSTYKTALATDIGANGTMLRSNGTRWLTSHGSAVLKGLGAPVTGIANSETNVLQTLLPAGSWQTNDTLRLWIAPTKSGTTDTCNLTVRIGTAGTTGDTAITGLSAYVTLVAGTVGGGSIYDIKLISATSAQRMGTTATGISGYNGGSGSGSLIAATTITDASANALYISINLASSGATNTVGVNAAQIQLITP